MRFLGSIHTIVILFIFAFSIIEKIYTHSKDRKLNNNIHEKVDIALDELTRANLRLNDRGNYVSISNSKRKVPESVLQKWAKDNTNGTSVWSVGPHEKFTATAPGIDKKHHVVNAYLEGYAPFETDNVWVPLYTLARHKEYQFDHTQYNGSQEIWQTSRQAFKFTRGDCEDHAIALADWLIEMGEDAWVVSGMLKDGGHAWVVLFKEGKTFILEATDKRRITRATDYPLASLKPDYHPQFMFNRTTFLYNNGTIYTTDYKNPNWIKKSTYTKGL